MPETDVKTDYLKEDPPMPGQDWVVMSIVNPPKDLLTSKNLFLANHFMVADINKQISAQAMHMAKMINARFRNALESELEQLSSSVDEDDNRVAQLLKKKLTDISLDEDELVTECRRQYEIDETEINDRYKVYLTENRQRLEREFDLANKKLNSVRGIKIRGGFYDMSDARAHAKYLRDNVEPAIHVFVAPMGKWLPVDFEADEVQDQDYMTRELNNLMQNYHTNVQERNAHFQERHDELLSQANTRNKMTQRERNQKLLRERRNAKMQAELNALSTAGTNNVTINKNEKPLSDEELIKLMEQE